jgi:hypothetical protein
VLFSLIFRDFLSFPARFVLFLSPASGLGLIFYRFSFRKWDDKVSRLIIKAKTWGKVFFFSIIQERASCLRRFREIFYRSLEPFAEFFLRSSL